jgi:hypothetical protein
MGLGEIAAGITVVDEQRDRGVATVDRTDDDLSDRLEPYADELPCTTEEAAALVDAYAAGESVGASARIADIAPMDGAKALHRLGESVSPLGPMGRDIVGDWLDGFLSRSEAIELAGTTDREFALAAYVETHDPIPGACDAVEGELSSASSATVGKRDALAETMSDATDLR